MSIQRFYHFLELKAKNPDAAVPPLDVALKSITEPDAEFVSQNKSVIDEFQRCFELKANIKVGSWLNHSLIVNLVTFFAGTNFFLFRQKKKSTRSTRERPSGSDDEKEAPKNLDEGKPLTTTRDNSAVKVENRDEKQSNKTHFNAPANNTVAVCESIENIAPIQEFEAMLSRRDSPDWVVKAIRGLKTKILDLLDDSIDQNNYDKALACLFALRKGCVLEQVCL